MGDTYLVVNPAKREYLEPGRFGESVRWGGLLTEPYCLLALKRLISDHPKGRSAIDGRWAGDPVVLAGGQGGSDNLHDRAADNFADISYLALVNLCADDNILNEILQKAAQSDEFFLKVCDAFMEHAPALTRKHPFTHVLGKDWAKRYERISLSEPWRYMRFRKSSS